MLGQKHLISFFVLMVAILAILVWLSLTLRSIRFQKRIRNYIVSTNEFESLSLFDKLINCYQHFEKKIVKQMEKMHINKIFYSRKEQGIDTKKLTILANKMMMSFLFLIIYIFLVIFRVVPFSYLFLLLVLCIGFYIPNLFFYIQKKVIQKQIEKDLLKAISLMSNSFQSGKSIIQAIQLVSLELDGPLKEEFDKIYQDMMHGLSFQNAFTRFQDRVEVEEVQYITSALSILNETGGNIVEVFSSIERSFYIRRKLDMELKATIASSRLVFRLLVLLPIFLWIVIGAFSPTYFNIFFKSTVGSLLFVIILCIYFIYIIIIYNIMEVEKY